MGVTARRAKKKAAPQPVVYEEDDDEEEEEDDFVPGQDDDEDDEGEFEAEDEEEEDMAGILEGHLNYDELDDLLHYKGDTFHLTTSLGQAWNPLRDPPPSTNSATGPMKGTIRDGEKEEEGTKLPERSFDLTWTISSEGVPLLGQPKGKSTGEDEEEDGKQKASPALFYNVVGREVAGPDQNVLIEFQGGFYPPSGKTTSSVALNCQFKYVIPETRASVAAAAAPMVAVAAAAASAGNDDDDVDDEADEGMNYDELIALHEDANVNVEELKRRYQHDDGKPAKKIKPAVDDDDDDVGF